MASTTDDARPTVIPPMTPPVLNRLQNGERIRTGIRAGRHAYCRDNQYSNVDLRQNAENHSENADDNGRHSRNQDLLLLSTSPPLTQLT